MDNNESFVIENKKIIQVKTDFKDSNLTYHLGQLHIRAQIRPNFRSAIISLWSLKL